MLSTIRRFSASLPLLTLIFVSPGPLESQAIKPALDHEDTYRWNAIRERVLSPDGAWLAYVLTPWDGDPTVVITSTTGDEERRFRGRAPAFTADSRFVAFRVPPVQSIVDSLKLEGTRRDDLPGDSIAIVTLADAFERDGGGVHRAGPISSFDIPEDGGAWIVYHLSESPEEEGEEEPDAEEPEAEEPETEEPERSAEYEKRHQKENGAPLVLRNLASGEEHAFPDALSYAVADAGTALAFAASTEDDGGDGVYVVDPATGAATEVVSGEGHYLALTFDEAGERLAFLTDRDEWELDQPAFSVYRASAAGSGARAVVTTATTGLPGGWWISEHGDLAFAEDGSRLFFGTAPRPAPEPDEKVLDEDKVEVDIWNWQDDYLQPMQLVQANRERDRSYLAVIEDGGTRIVQLGRPDVPDVERTEDGSGRYALATTDMPYRQELSWDGRYQDAYAVDLLSGSLRRLAQRVRGFGGAGLSPGGTYAYWWDGGTRDWKAARMDGSGDVVSLTEDIPVAFHNELDDHPQAPPPYGSVVWVEGDVAVLVYDKHDVWRTDPAGLAPPVRLTQGREAGVRYRVMRIDPDGPGGGFGFGFGGGGAVPEGDVYLSVFDLVTKGAGYARGRTEGAGAVVSLLSGDFRFGTPLKAEDADRVVWTRESFVEFPDLWVSGLDFSDARKVSDANPQQDEYRWGTAELYSWLSADRTELDGILIKPDGFDPSRKYPLMVYFYERMSDGLHAYTPPVPNRASIRYPFYASRGYVVFIPDIPYEIGYPGESALDAVVPGVLGLIGEGFVDPDRIGVQGHSWGGYQIAYMITKTNLFAAAEAGAPVSNMTSAYGGIRWQSGMSRMFQYERTQSRIGGTLWDERDRYIHNSPVFFADKIETPLLMLHNDEDGAVPWYQGIEMFVAMRRLGKPVFMLNYNGEAHGLTQQRNQTDWTIRMQQFFDHYLLDAPAPVWMERGVPAVLKGREMGLELVEMETETTGEGGGG